MKKSILIGVLAALMLFAFVACDNNSGVTGAITYVEATTSVDYLVGEKPVASDFTFTGYTLDGNPVDIPANQFSYSGLALTKAGEQEIAFTWTAGPTAKATITAYDIESFTVDSSASTVQKTYYTVETTAPDADDTAFSTINPTGVVVTVTYDTDKTRVLDNDSSLVKFELGTVATDKFTAEAAWPTAAEDDDTDYVVGVTVDGVTKTYDVDFLANVVKSIYFDIPADYIVYYDEDQTAAEATDTLDGSKVLVKAEMANGQRGKILSNNLVFATSANALTGADAKTAVNQIALTNLPGVTLYAKYNGTDVVPNYDGASYITSRSISIQKDTRVGIMATVTNATLTIGTDYADGATTEVKSWTGVTVNYVMASDEDGTATGKALTLNADEDGYTITPNKFTAADGAIAGRPVTVTITAKSNGSWTDTVVATLAN